jgi:biotin synthase
LFIKDFQPHFIGIGPFIPHRQILKQAKGGTVEDTLPLLALARLLVPDALYLPLRPWAACTQRGRNWLEAGAMLWMPNMTPVRYEQVELYENKICLMMKRALPGLYRTED